MISHRLRSLPVNGYYEYLSQTRCRVNVTPNEVADSEETPKRTTTHHSVATVMENGNKTALVRSSSADNVPHQLSEINTKDVTKWSSTDVQHWIEDQCRKFELTKATSAKFQMNGQALVLLTKHDFLRRSPDGGEVLYYALQRLISPNKFNSVRVGHSLVRSKTTRQNPRIIELDSDTDDHNSVTSNSSSTKPIVEEPDDPPLLRSSESGTAYESYPQQHYSHSFLFNNPHMRQTMYSMPTAASAAYFHQQQQPYANAYMYGQHPMHHVHAQMPQQSFYQAHPQQHANVHFFNQYYAMMAAQGILIEVIDPEEANNLIASGVSSPSQPNDHSTNGPRFDGQEHLYLVTMNGQRFIMTEEYIRQIVLEIQQQQLQQQQQQFQQQHHFHHQQQQQQFQHPQQQQQYAYQAQPQAAAARQHLLHGMIHSPVSFLCFFFQ